MGWGDGAEIGAEPRGGTGGARRAGFYALRGEGADRSTWTPVQKSDPPHREKGLSPPTIPTQVHRPYRSGRRPRDAWTRRSVGPSPPTFSRL